MPRFRTLLIVAFALYLLTASTWAQEGGTAFAVAFITPENTAQDVATDSTIVVSFDSPVVPLVSTAQQAKLPNPMTIEPAIAGVGAWVNTSIYVFKPDEPLVGSTQYTVTVSEGLHAADGSRLIDDYTWSFITAAPRITEIQVSDSSGYYSLHQRWYQLDSIIKVTFNQPMPRQQIESAFRLAPEHTSDSVVGTFEWNTEDTELTFTPAVLLQIDTQYVVSLHGLGLQASYTHQFSTIPYPTVIETYPANGEQAAHPDNGVRFNFASPMNSNSFRDRIRIEPEPEEWTPYISLSSVGLSFSMRYNTTYTVTLLAGIKDIYGNQMEEDAQLRFSTGPISNYGKITCQHGLVTTSALTETTTIPGVVRGTASADILLSRLPLDVLPRMVAPIYWRPVDARGDQYETYTAPSPDPGTILRRWRADMNSGDEFNLPIGIALDLPGEKLPPGLYRVQTDMDGDTGWNDQCNFALAVTTANLTIKRDPDGLLVWVTDLQTAAPLANIPVTVYDYNGEAAASRITDEYGLAILPPISAQVTLPDGIQQMSAFASVVAQSDSVYGIWTSSDGYRAGGGATYLYTDRAVYRPGETVYFRGVMRGGEDIAYTLPDIDSIEAHTYGYGTDDLLDVELPVSPFGTFSGQFTIPEDYPLGSLMIAVGAPVFYECGECYPDYGPSTSVEIADYRVPEIKVNLTAQKPMLIEGETLNVLINAQYYSGGGVMEAPVQYYITSNTVPFNYSGPGRYRFDPDPSCCEGQTWFYQRDEFDAGYRTDMNGHILFTQDMSGFVPRTSQLTVEATVNDATGLAVSGRTSVLLHPSELYVGLNMQNYFARAEESTSIDLIVVNPDSRPVIGEHIRLEVTEIRWTRTEIRDDYGRWQWTREAIPVNEQLVVSGVGGTAYAEFTPPNAGIYHVLATVIDSAGRENRSTLTFYVSGDQPVLWGQQKSHDLTIIPDRSSYRPGDTAKVLIAVPFVERGETWLLISAERHERFVTEVVKATGTTLIYNLPITDAHSPNVHVTVTMVQGAGTDGLPDYRQGAVSLRVEPVSRRLNVDVSLSSSAASPGETLTIDLHVTDSDGKPVQAELGVSLVDQAVLALRELPDRSLESVFYSPRGNNVQATTGMSALLELIYTYEGEPGSGNGGGGYGAAPLVLRDTFVTTPLWQPHVVTDADGRASISVDMPDNLTAWRLGVKAITADTLVGDVSSEIVSRLPFWVQPAAPRFFVSGDHVRLAAIVHNGTDMAQTATVSLDARGVKLLDPISQEVIIDAGGQVRVEWRAVPGETEAVDLTFSAVAASGLQDAVKPRLGEETLIPVYRYTARDTVGTSGILFKQGERTEQIVLPEGIDIEQGTLTVEVAPSLSALAIDSFNALSTYPRADIEYLISRFYPNAVMYNALLKLNVDADEISAQLEEALATAIPLLMAAQNADGGWGWFGDMESDTLVTAYALLGLSEAYFADFELPRQSVDRAAYILRASLTQPSLNTPPYELNRQAFVLYALSHCRRLGACTGEYSRLPAALNWLVENRDELSTAARAYLLMSLLELAPESTAVDTLIADLQGTVVLSASGAHWEEPDPSNWGSTTRTTALTTAALIRARPDSPLLPSAVRWLVIARSSGHWLNTQEIVWSVVAFADWMANTGELQGNYDYLITLNKDILIDASVTPARIRHTETASVPLDDIFSTKPNTLTVTHGKGAGVLYYTAALDVQLPAGEVDAVNRGVSVTRDYFVGDAELPTHEARVGDIVTVRLTMIVGQDLQYFMLDDRLPAGLEAVDLRLSTSPRAASAPTLMREDARWYWGWWWFDRTELRDEGAALYADVLPRGTYVFSYQARAVTSGTFQAIPSYAQQIYFPDVFGRSDGALFTIRNTNGLP